MINLENRIERDELIYDYFNKGYACDIREVYQAVVNTVADLENANYEKIKEIEKLKEDNEYLNKVNIELSTENKRLNNIISELEKWLDKKEKLTFNSWNKGIHEVQRKLQELKGSNEMSEEELIETLKAFEKNRVEQLEEPAKNLFYAIMKIADEIERLNKCYCERTDCSGRIKNGKKYESMQEENKRLHSIIKEVREYIEKYDFITGYYEYNYDDVNDTYTHYTVKEELLEILDKKENI